MAVNVAGRRSVEARLRREAGRGAGGRGGGHAAAARTRAARRTSAPRRLQGLACRAPELKPASVSQRPAPGVLRRSGSVPSTRV